MQWVAMFNGTFGALQYNGVEALILALGARKVGPFAVEESVWLAPQRAAAGGDPVKSVRAKVRLYKALASAESVLEVLVSEPKSHMMAVERAHMLGDSSTLLHNLGFEKHFDFVRRGQRYEMASEYTIELFRLKCNETKTEPERDYETRDGGNFWIMRVRRQLASEQRLAQEGLAEVADLTKKLSGLVAFEE